MSGPRPSDVGTRPPCACGHLHVVHVPGEGRCTGPCDCPAYTPHPAYTRPASS